MTKKYLVKRKRKFYVTRKKDGTFKKWTLVKKRSPKRKGR